MDRDGLSNLPSPLSDEDLRKMAGYAKTRTKAFVSVWTPDQVLVQRFAEVAEELMKIRNQTP